MDKSTEVTPQGTNVSLNLNELRAHIAAELAAGLSDPEAICARYGISDAQWEVLRRNKTFRSMVKEQLELFKGDTNAATRIRAKANIALEDAIPEVYSMIGDADVSPNAQIEAAKLLAKLGGVDAPNAGKDAAAAGSGFSINIMLGEKPVSIVGTNAGGETQGLTVDAE